MFYGFRLTKDDYVRDDLGRFASAGGGDSATSDLGKHRAYSQKQPGLDMYLGNENSRAVNRSLRGAGPVPRMPVSEFVVAEATKHLDAAFKNAPPLPEMTVYRTFDLGTESDKVSVGSVLTDKGYMSTTTDRDWAENFSNNGKAPAFYELKVPKGSKGLAPHYDNYEYHKDRGEVLFPKGSRVRVDSVFHDKDLNFRVIQGTLLS